MTRQRRTKTPPPPARVPAPAPGPVGPEGSGAAPLRPWRAAWPALLLVPIVWAAFGPILNNGFVGWDDPLNFLENPAFRGLGPAQFRWRRTLHEIVAIEGPERIAAPWWTSTAPVRDYFHAEDGQGRRFWLYREGLYGSDRPRWFLHGLFG